MKRKNSQEPGRTENRAQLILIGGLVIAVAVVAIALVVGGGIFSQSTNDDGGLSSFVSETADQIQAAQQVGKEDLKYVNENSTLYEGAYPSEVCGELINSTEVQQLVATQLGEGESVLNINVEEECGDEKSWLTGQAEVANLPSVNVTDPVETTTKKTCGILHTETGYDMNSTRDDFVNELENHYGGLNNIPSDPDNSTLVAELKDSTVDEDPIENDPELTLEEYIHNCIDLNFETGRAPIDVVFSIDTTGSMSNGFPTSKMSYTKDGAKAVLDDTLKEKDKVGLVEYNTELGTDDIRCFRFGFRVRCFNFGYERDGAREAESMNKLTPSHKSDLKSEINSFFPDGGTDITTGLDTAKDVLENGDRPDATQHIVLMTDGKHNEDSDEFTNPTPTGYINANENDYQDTTVHTVALGDITDVNPPVLKQLANKDSIYSNTRPNGTYVQSSNPSDAEDIFKDVIGDIKDNTSKVTDVNATTPDPDLELNATLTSSSGTVEEIYDTRMRVTQFTGNGSYLLKFTDTDSNDNEVVAWQMKVNNTLVGPPTPNVGYKVEFSSETDGSLNRTLTVPDPSSSDPVVNLSDPGQYVWLDLTNKDPGKPRLDVGGLTETEMTSRLGDNPDVYIEKAWNEVQDEMAGDNTETDNTVGVAIVAEEFRLNPFGEVNGTFSLEFKPIGGNFTNVGGINGGGFGADCGSPGAGPLPDKCGTNDPGNDRDAVSTAQIRKTELTVTVEGPEGRSNRTITIPPDDKYSYDILE